jgi:uncharacterized protein (DUF433 family)
MDAYVESREGNLYVGHSRVTLQTLIEAWQSGRTPEQLRDSFPTVLPRNRRDRCSAPPFR